MDLLQKWIYEAEGDSPPDINTNNETPPVDQSVDNGPPDMDENFSDDTQMQGGEMSSDENFSDDMMMGDQQQDSSQEEQDPNANMELDDKVSAIMNNQLYQRCLSMLNNVDTEITSLSSNSDVMLSILKDNYSEIIDKLKKLDENIRLYLNNNFVNESYSKNLLFFNMCLNLLKLINDDLEEKIKKGIKTAE